MSSLESDSLTSAATSFATSATSGSTTSASATSASPSAASAHLPFPKDTRIETCTWGCTAKWTRNRHLKWTTTCECGHFYQKVVRICASMTYRQEIESLFSVLILYMVLMADPRPQLMSYAPSLKDHVGWLSLQIRHHTRTATPCQRCD